MIQTYRKKSVEIKAVQWTEENTKEAIEWIDKNGGELRLRIGDLSNNAIFIKTLEGDMKITEGDYIIQGVKGEFYPCKPDIFEMTYDKAVEELLNEYNKPETRQRLIELRDQESVLMSKPAQETPLIVFSTKQEEVIKLSEGKFYFRGEEVEDKYQVYERFHEWLKMAEETK